MNRFKPGDRVTHVNGTFTNGVISAVLGAGRYLVRVPGKLAPVAVSKYDLRLISI